jgi:glycyl-tRNA synthetase
MQANVTLEKITALAKRRGFIYPTSEIYGGLASSYDYGPLGTELLRNIRDLWWREMIHKRVDMVGLDSQILLHPQTWVASGHVDEFNDPLVEDKVTHRRYRADFLLTAYLENHPQPQSVNVEELDIDQIGELLAKFNVKSPDGNPITEPKIFNIMFETAIGTVAGEKSTLYLRGETAQGIFTNFKQILDSTRMQLPFGIGQIGKSFRNEITTGQFVFRTLEFEQAEIEYFFDPEQTDWRTLFESWQQIMWEFVEDYLGISPAQLRWRRHSDKERSHYSQETFDLDYNYPFGFKELWGIAYRTDYDLKRHVQFSGRNLEYTDPRTGRTFIPHVIEPAAGINRFLLMVLCDAYREDSENQRVVLSLRPALAPYKVAVFPLLKNRTELVEKARSVFDGLASSLPSTWDERGNIGKRYYYQDEIGTPFCVTIDFQTLEDDTVTVRERDNMQQVRVAIDQLLSHLQNRLVDG